MRKRGRRAQLLGPPAHEPAAVEVAGDDRRRRRHAGVDQEHGRRQQRIAGEVGADAGGRAVRRLDVGAGVAAVAHRAQVQHGRTRRGADVVGELLGDVVDGDRIGALDPLVAQPRPAGERGLDPARRARHADPPPVVLAHEQQRHRHALVGGVGGGVEGALGRRVVERGVAEAGHGDGVDRPPRRQPEAGGAADGERHAHRPRQVGGDRRGLRDDGQRGVAEDLVAAAGDRLVDRRQQAEEHVVDAVVARHLAGSGQVEAAGAVVQQRRVGRAHGGGHQRVGLMAGRADGVEALALGPQPAGGVVEVAAGELGVEDVVEAGRRQRGPGRQRGVGRDAHRLTTARAR